jgi:hypothetical protein
VTVQPCYWGFASYQFALLGVVEATLAGDEERNRFCRPITYWDKNADYLAAFLATMLGQQARATQPELATWIKETRLHPLGRMDRYRDHPSVPESRERIKRFGAAAVANIPKLLSARS